MLNASVGFQRVLGRLRRPQRHRLASTRTSHADRARPAVAHMRPARPRTRSSRASRLVPQDGMRGRPSSRPAEPGDGRSSRRIGPDRAVAVAVVGDPPRRVGRQRLRRPAGRGHRRPDRRRIRAADRGRWRRSRARQPPARSMATGDVAVRRSPRWPTAPLGDVRGDRPRPTDQVEPRGPGRGRGTVHRRRTLVKPIAVDTTVPDGSALVKTYKVKPGDTLAAIAAKFHVSTMSVAWANNLKSKTDIHTGQTSASRRSPG